MPKPVYIICCDKSITDKADNIISLLNLIEKFTIEIDSSSLPPNSGKKMMLPKDFHVVVCWLRDDNEESDEFEANLMIVAPDGTEMHSDISHPLVFEKGLPLHRTTYRLPGIPMGGNGVCRVIGRIRNLTSKGDWVVQEYPILIETVTKKQAETNKEIVK